MKNFELKFSEIESSIVDINQTSHNFEINIEIDDLFYLIDLEVTFILLKVPKLCT
jgi:hypothetical protein